jgi:hypothetical protein
MAKISIMVWAILVFIGTIMVVTEWQKDPIVFEHKDIEQSHIPSNILGVY